LSFVSLSWSRIKPLVGLEHTHGLVSEGREHTSFPKYLEILRVHKSNFEAQNQILRLKVLL